MIGVTQYGSKYEGLDDARVVLELTEMVVSITVECRDAEPCIFLEHLGPE